MRRRLSTTLDSGNDAVSEACRLRSDAGAHHGTLVLRRPERKNPAVGTPGQIFFVIGVYGFKYAAWLLLVTPESAERFVLIFQPLSVLVLLLSCSSITFSNLTEPFAFSHRFLFVCALTRPWVGTVCIKQDACRRQKNQQKQLDMSSGLLGARCSSAFL